MIKVSYYFDNQTIPKNVSDEEQRFVLLRLQSEVEVPRTKLNLCFVLDKSGSMDGAPIENLKRAVKDVVDLMEEEDRVSVILFDSEARVLISNSPLDRKKEIKNRIEEIDALGGTCIDEGLEKGIEQIEVFKEKEYVNWLILLTDGKNEHGDDEKCLYLAKEARKRSISITALGLGKYWDPTLLEKIADFSSGRMFYLENPEDLRERFKKELQMLKNIAFKDLVLKVKLTPIARFSELNPGFVVTPQIQRVEPLWNGEEWEFEVGNMSRNSEKLVLLHMFLKAPPHPYINKVAEMTLQYKDLNGKTSNTESHTLIIEATELYSPQINQEVREVIDRVSVYLQQQIVESLLEENKPNEALTVLQTMEHTVMKLEDEELKGLIEENIEKIKEEGTISEDLRLKTKVQTKMVMEE